MVPDSRSGDAPVAPSAAAVGATTTSSEVPPPPPLKPPKRKPGRPKALRLDTPPPAAETKPTTVEAPAPQSSPSTQPPATESESPKPAPPGRQFSDVTPPTTHPAHPSHPAHHSRNAGKPKPTLHTAPVKHHPPHAKPHVHKVGVPPLHYGSVLKTSLRARVSPRWFVIGVAGAVTLAAAIAYGAWLGLSGQLTHLPNEFSAAAARLTLEFAVLAALYYIGHSLGQTAIIYGSAREADHRPVSLIRQIGAGINTFGSRLLLDLSCFIIELFILSLILILVIVAGGNWPVNIQLQIVIIFCTFLLLLYVRSAVALMRGLGGVALTLTGSSPWSAARLAWQLIRRRFELLGMRFVAVALELILALPLAVLAAALIVTAPPNLHLIIAFGVGFIALIAGALLGAGSASWWQALYRRLVVTDRPAATNLLLSGRQPEEARRAPLTLVVALSSFLIAAALAIPWFNN